jgi:hypothetical protein
MKHKIIDCTIDIQADGTPTPKRSKVRPSLPYIGFLRGNTPEIKAENNAPEIR